MSFYWSATVDQYLASEADLVYVITSEAEVCKQFDFYACLIVNMVIPWPKQYTDN